MYRVLLVDDEPWALRGLRESFAWEELGFRIIAETTRPAEALEIILAEMPDAVFTDIRMPRFSGIELMQQARARGCAGEFVVVSGFSEFTYAQEALRLGAFDYCLKPLQTDYVVKLLERLRGKLDAQSKNKEAVLLDALADKRKDIADLLASYGLADSADFYQVAVTAGSRLANLPECAGNITVNAGQDKSILVFNTEKDLYPALSKELPPRTVAGLSALASSVEDIPQLVEEAQTAAAGAFLYGQDRVYVYRKKNISAANRFLKNLIPQLESADAEQRRRAAGGIAAFLRENEMTMEDLDYLWNQLAAHAMSQSPEAAFNSGMEFMTWEQLVYQFKDIESICETLCQVHAVPDEPLPRGAEPGAGQTPAFDKLLTYIQSHYGEQLFLRELARDFFINYNYCCLLFRKRTGSTFSDYINKVRMEKSREMLRNHGLTIGEVAQRAGYNDYFYFIRVFKKYNGTTPTKFRKEAAAGGR